MKMKKNLIPLLVVVALFAIFACVSYSSKGNADAPNDANSTATATAASSGRVKICPRSGLPCEGDGDCGDECGDDCESAEK